MVCWEATEQTEAQEQFALTALQVHPVVMGQTGQTEVAVLLQATEGQEAQE
jgi:hypothetical protein